ncbi:MAG: HYR domain-containing protein [Saprospiraceae bacterium]|nr:HYR domain-containing protein [Saprospiraceae bacterium]
MMSPIYTTLLDFKCLIFKTLVVVSLVFAVSTAELKAQVLTCPDDYVVNLPQNDCSVAIYYDSLDWSTNFPANDPVFFPFPGTFLPTGITTITLAVSDNNNNFYTCDFEVNILAYNSTNFDCPGVASVSLNGECERMLTASDILGSTFNPCDEDYMTEIQEGNNWVPGVIDANDVCSSFNVQLTNNETGHSCESIVTVTGGEPSSITCPPDVVQYCNEPTDTFYTGSPTLTGCFENVALSYSDELTFTQCPDTFAFQIIRTWVATSPNGSQSTCEQDITGRRFPASLVVFPDDVDDVSSPALLCNDTLNLTQTAHPDITGWPLVGDFPPDDNVHCKFAVSYVDNITPLCGDSYRIKRAWSVVRLCGPTTLRDTQTILVLDEMAPVFEIPDTLFFSNSGGCVDSVFLPPANVLSECSNFNFLLQSDWGNFSSNGAWIHPDTLPGNYMVDYKLTDACGNDTTQTLVLKITDETLVACPPSDTVSCDYYLSVISPALQNEDYDVLDVHGMPVFYSNCSFDITQDATADVDGCGNGVVTRNIYATNASDTLSCTQSIVVQHVSNFVAQFSPDTSICVAPAQANLPEPNITMVNCEAISSSFTDMVVPSGITGCYTLLRTWVIINDCAYSGAPTGADTELDPLTFQDNGDGYMEYTQTIHVNNNAPVTFPNGCEILDLYLGADDCTFDLVVPTPVVEGCGSGINLTVSGSLGNSLGAPVGITPGAYSVTYTATDGCGKMQTCMTSFEVFDTVAPVAICRAAPLVVELMQGCTVDVWVSDFDNGSHDNCDNFLLHFHTFKTRVIGQTFTSCDIGLVNIEVWVTDNFGNQSSCQTQVIIQSNLSGCDCDPVLSGKIETEIGFDIHNVKVTVTSPNGFDQHEYTDVNGDYEIFFVSGDDYTITPEKDTMPLNGVTTFDLVTIRKHILGIDTLDSPYKMIAADINSSGAITTFDLVEIRKLILIINTNFPSNKSWRFVDASYVFPDPMNPFSAPFPESIIVNDVTNDQLNLNFIGIKIGDVNNSAITSPFTTPGESLKKSD